jgi:surfactin synthase thioesterase subunit
MFPIKLYCFPFAGGNRYSYRQYEMKAPSALKVVTLEYPGRGGKVQEACITDMRLLVDHLYDKMRNQHRSGAFALYGHSMGAVVAYYLARKIVANNEPPPMHLFLTGTTGPSSLSREMKKRHLMGKKEFIEELRHLDGCPEEILQDPDLLEYFEPILRADFEVSETFTHEADIPLNIPFTVITGTEEDMAPEDIYLWQRESLYPVEFYRLPGKHFFIFKSSGRIMEIIASKLSITVKQVSNG